MRLFHERSLSCCAQRDKVLAILTSEYEMANNCYQSFLLGAGDST